MNYEQAVGELNPMSSELLRFKSVEELKKNGFEGFIKISEYSSKSIPDAAGTYSVLYIGRNKPEFLQNGTGGFFKGRDPNVPIEVLEKSWIDGTIVLYIGKAGRTNSSATLRSRIRQYLKFGQGEPIGHWGGRFIWQIKDNGNLLICWRTLSDGEPRELEKSLIEQFQAWYGKKPFANLSN